MILGHRHGGVITNHRDFDWVVSVLRPDHGSGRHPRDVAALLVDLCADRADGVLARSPRRHLHHRRHARRQQILQLLRSHSVQRSWNAGESQGYRQVITV